MVWCRNRAIIITPRNAYVFIVVTLHLTTAAISIRKSSGRMLWIFPFQKESRVFFSLFKTDCTMQAPIKQERKKKRRAIMTKFRTTLRASRPTRLVCKKGKKKKKGCFKISRCGWMRLRKLRGSLACRNGFARGGYLK